MSRHEINKTIEVRCI